MYNQSRQMVAELQAIESRTRRAWESESAIAANERDYNISPESKAALERGDRQRLTGIYEHEHAYGPNYCTQCGKRNPEWWLYNELESYLQGD